MRIGLVYCIADEGRDKNTVTWKHFIPSQTFRDIMAYARANHLVHMCSARSMLSERKLPCASPGSTRPQLLVGLGKNGVAEADIATTTLLELDLPPSTALDWTNRAPK